MALYSMVKTICVFTAVDSSIEKSDSFPNQALSEDLDKARSWEFKVQVLSYHSTPDLW